MGIYFAITLGTASLSFLATLVEKKSKIVSLVLLLIVAFIFCYFAGARSLEVGTDTSTYGIESYQWASIQSFEHFFFSGAYSQIWASVYKVIVWCSANLFRSSFWFFFTIQAFTVLPVIGACRITLKEYMAFGVLLYGLVFYPMSFNIMRQMMAMGFVLLQFSLLSERKMWLSMVALILAISIHHTAVLGLLVYPVYMFSHIRKWTLGVKIGLLTAVLLLARILYRQVLELGSNLLNQYAVYTSWSIAQPGSGQRTLYEIVIILSLSALLGWLLIDEGNKNDDDDRDALMMLVVSGAILFSLCLVSFWLYRIGLYYLYFSILLIPLSAKRISGDSGERLVFILFEMVLLAVFAVDYYAVHLQNEVVPYEFASSYINSALF